MQILLGPTCSVSIAMLVYLIYVLSKHAGATTGTLPGAKCLYLAARSQDAVQAVVGISLADGGTLGSFERNLLLTLLDVVSLAIERIRLTRTKNQVQRLSLIHISEPTRL